jgi:7-cyano-7-deazaguanine synthase in queuosine biosynthesis
MNLTYGNQTIEFWTNIKEQINKSPHKEQALKDIVFDDDFIPKQVVVSLSGGCDSSSATYLTLKHFPQIEIFPFMCNDVNAPKDADAAREIVEYLQKKFPNGKLNDITIKDFNDREVGGWWPKAYDSMLDNQELYGNMSVTAVAKILQLDKLIPEFMNEFKGAIRLDGMTANPPKQIRMAFAKYAKERFPEINYTPRNLERIQGETRRDVSNKPNITYNVYQPYINVNKRFVAGVFKEEGLMEDLFPITRSCVGSGKQTKDFTAWCWQCFWCYEKAWAFNLPNTHMA